MAVRNAHHSVVTAYRVQARPWQKSSSLDAALPWSMATLLALGLGLLLGLRFARSRSAANLLSSAITPADAAVRTHVACEPAAAIDVEGPAGQQHCAAEATRQATLIARTVSSVHVRCALPRHNPCCSMRLQIAVQGTCMLILGSSLPCACKSVRVHALVTTLSVSPLESCCSVSASMRQLEAGKRAAADRWRRSGRRLRRASRPLAGNVPDGGGVGDAQLKPERWPVGVGVFSYTDASVSPNNAKAAHRLSAVAEHCDADSAGEEET